MSDYILSDDAMLERVQRLVGLIDPMLAGEEPDIVLRVLFHFTAAWLLARSPRARRELLEVHYQGLRALLEAQQSEDGANGIPCRTNSLGIQIKEETLEEMSAQDGWVTVFEAGDGGCKSMILPSRIERNGTLVRAPFRYITDPLSPDRNGRVVAELVTFEEYDLKKSVFRAHRMALVYVDGGVSEFMAEQEWRPATAGNEKHLLYLRDATMALGSESSAQ